MADNPSEQKPPPSGEESSEPGRSFKVSELTFNLPEELQQEFEQQVERLKVQEQAATEKMKALLDQEKQLEEAKLRLEKENAEFRATLQEQRDQMQKRVDEETELSRREIARIQEELEQALGHAETLRTEKQKLLDDYETNRSRMSEEFIRHDEVFRSKFDEVTDLLTLLAEQEKEFRLKKEADHKKIQEREQQLAKSAALQSKRLKEIQAQGRAISAERKNLKIRMKKDYDNQVAELKKDFSRRAEYLVRRVDELDAQEERLAQDGEKLRLKEQALVLEAQEKADQHLKKKQAELEKLETKIKKREKKLIAQEEALSKERELIFNALDDMKEEIRENRFPLEELKDFNREQEKLIRRKKKGIKAYDTELQNLREEFQEKFKAVDKEKEGVLVKIQEERQPIVNQKKKLREIERKLLERERTELERLNEEYDELKNSFEVERIEKEAELDEIQDRIDEEEDKLADKQDKMFIDEREAAKRIKENEEQILEQVQEIQEAREQAAQLQESVQKFLADFEETYTKIQTTQSKEYDIFKQKISELEDEASTIRQTLKEKKKTVEKESTAQELALKERLEQRENIVEIMEKELRQRVEDYKDYVKELAEVKESMIEEDESRKTELMDSLVKYEDKLSHLGQAFEELSEAFHKEQEKGNIDIVPEEDEKKALEYDDALAKAEWPLVIRHQLGLAHASEKPPHVTEYIYKLADKWEEWIRIPPGKFQMGKKNSKDSAPYQEVRIEKSFLLTKYPVTNIEFYRFIAETGYRTEAESFVDGIVYHHGHAAAGRGSGRSSYSNPTLAPENSAFWLCPEGRPDSLNAKYHHPVTQVTWNDAQEYCLWKSKQLEKKVRLPTEAEWEYVAGNFGKLSADEFFWSDEEILNHCNIEETGIHGTTPVDHFPEQGLNGGVCDLFGNVFEWVQDTRIKTGPAASGNNLIYKIVRGGSFITNYNHIAHWRRLAFLTNYCTSFLGFRTACEEE